MRKSDRGLIYQDLDRLFRRGTVTAGDGALLESFLSEGNESAFEALVNRHGPMVRGVCRRVLSSPHDADDAFQATFLVLVRKGRRLRDPDRLAPWLHGVATREALKARARLARLRNEPIIDVPAREGSNADWCDVMPIIDAELARLPAKHRDVLVACLLDGATVEEASQRLACPLGTVKSRLARAREALRTRLTSRGVAPAVAVAALTTTDALAFASPVSSTLTRATLRTVTTQAVAPGVVALIKGVASIMLSKSTLTTLVLAAGVSLGGLAAVWIRPSLAQVHLPQTKEPQAKAENISDTTIRDQHIKKILLAVHNYRDVNDAFPAGAITDRWGQPLLSWRVAILPYLDQNELYQKFHLNEPWDSPHNKALIDQMPAVYETPGAPTTTGQTRIRGIAGKGTIFDPALMTPDRSAEEGGMMGSMMASMKASGRAKAARNGRGPQLDPSGQVELESEEPREDDPGMMMSSGTSAQGDTRPLGVRIPDITDGTSNTIFLVVARDSTQWTKPGELPFILGQDTPGLDDSDPRGAILGLCDGSVHFLAEERKSIFPLLLSRNGGEVVDTSWFPPTQQPSPAAEHPRPTPTAAQPQPAPAQIDSASSGSSVEQRLQRLEQKLDRLLEKLDAK